MRAVHPPTHAHTHTVNVSALLMGCVGTEITEGHRAAGQGQQPSDLDESHTSGAAGPAAKTTSPRQRYSALCYSGLMDSDDEKLTLFLCFCNNPPLVLVRVE